MGPLCGGKLKPLEEFYNREGICKSCKNEKLKILFKEKGRPYQTYKMEVKSKAKCVSCGCDDPKMLEFDHIAEKNIAIAHCHSKAKIKLELANTQFLCIWCHRVKTHNDITLKSFHYDDDENDIDGIACNGPLCDGVKRSKDMFYILKSGFKKPCKLCLAKISQDKRLMNKAHVIKIKLMLKHCAICSREVTNDNYSCFDFDHDTDNYTKTAAVSELAKMNKDARELIDEEIKKCQLLCCYCHLNKTRQQLNYR